MAEKNRALDAELRKWQAEFNAEVLQPKGIFCMSQSNCSTTTETRVRVENGVPVPYTVVIYHCFRWIAFAFGANAVQALKDEPHLFGYIWEGDCCNPNGEHLVQCVV